MMHKSFLLSPRPIGLLVVACSLITLTGCPAPNPTPKGAIDPVSATSAANPSAPVVSESSAPAAASYSIADRRIIDYYDTKFMPEAEARITKACQDAKVKITINWSSFGNGAEASKNLEALTNSNAINQSVDSTVSALESVCTDKIGREAVASKFTGIQVLHQNGLPEASFKFANGIGTLTVNVAESKSPWMQDIQKALESGL
jgi:hypothetical protein